jgi:phospholipid/cholesterol/gamma-HCH transport system substrate-binding protein
MSAEKNIERSVGVFVFLGIIITCSMILYFGKVGDRFRGGYGITVEFGNAGALVKGAQVLNSGVLVGKVHEIHLQQDGEGVDVDVTLFEGTKIRKDASFLIKQSGLLGDQNIVVVPKKSDQPFLANGDRVRGNDPFDFSEAANLAGEAIRKLNSAIDQITSEESVGNIKTTITNFSDLAKKLQTTSDRLTSVLDQAKSGKGTVGRLLSDDSLFEELRTLIHNWRVYGLLHREKATEKYPSDQDRKTQVPRSSLESDGKKQEDRSAIDLIEIKKASLEKNERLSP